MNKSQELLIQLVYSAANNKKIDSSLFENIEPKTIESMWELANRHALAPMVASAFLDNKLCDGSLKDFFAKEVYRSMLLAQRHETIISDISNVLDTSEIPYILLKGSVLKNYYPHDWYRIGCDIDILIHENDLESAVKSICDKLGYTVGQKLTHDISLYTPDGIHIELHYTLMEYFPLTNEVLSGVWQNSTQIQNCAYKMCNEFFYLYHIAHMAQHFMTGGCGIKPFLDMCIIDSSFKLDEDKFDNLLTQSGLMEFYKNVHYMTCVWFGDEPRSEIADIIEKFVFDGGVYGTLENTVAVQNGRKGNMGFIVSRIFPSSSRMKVLYPKLNEHPSMLPVYYTKRLFKLFTHNRVNLIKTEIEYNSHISQDKNQSMKKMLKTLGLDKNIN